MRRLSLVGKQVEFQATKINEIGRALKHQVKLEINWKTNEACLSVDTEKYMLTDLRKGAESTLDNLQEDVHFLQGKTNYKYSLITTITNCGVNPPEFWVILENTNQEIIKNAVYNITHNIQNDINYIINSSQSRSMRLHKKYYDLVTQRVQFA